MLFLGMMKINTFARYPEVRSHSNYKVYLSLALVS